MFFNFWVLFLKIFVFWSCNFSFCLIGLLIKSTQFLSVVVGIYRDLVTGEAFFSSLAIVTSLLNIKTNFFNTVMQLVNPNYAYKIRVKWIKTTQTKLLQWYIFYPFAKDPDHGVKMWQNLVFFLLAFIICLSRFELFSLSNFSNFPSMDKLDISCLGTP